MTSVNMDGLRRDPDTILLARLVQRCRAYADRRTGGGRIVKSSRVGLAVLVSVGLLVGVEPASADTTAQSLPFSQDWSNTGLITADDDWSGVSGVIGYRGDDLTTATGTDPQTITADGSATPVDVIANQTNPNTLATGGVAEFHIADPSVALNGSGTADAPHVVVNLVTTGFQDISVSYNAQDLDGSVDNAAQQLATQYRAGASGVYTNLPAGYIADATAGPSLAGLTTPVAVALPADANDKPLVQVRVITTNAVGNDEWVGVDDIQANGVPIVGDTAPVVASVSPANGAANVAVDANVDVTFSEPVNVTGAWFDICLRHVWRSHGRGLRWSCNVHARPGHGLRERRIVHGDDQRGGCHGPGRDRPTGLAGRELLLLLQYGPAASNHRRGAGRVPHLASQRPERQRRGRRRHRSTHRRRTRRMDPGPDSGREPRNLRRRLRLHQRGPGGASRRSRAGQRHGERVPRRRGSRQPDDHPDHVLERECDHRVERQPSTRTDRARHRWPPPTHGEHRR